MGEPDKDAEGKPKPQPPKLPDNAPAALKQFLECKGNRITFKGGKLPFVKGKPTISFEAGEKAGEVKVSVGWGILSLTIPASVKDGQLSVDTSTAQKVFKAAAEFSDDLKDFDPKAIDDWVKELNDWLKANNRKLGPLELKDGKLTISKVAAAAPQKAMAPGKAAAPEPGKPGIKGKAAVGATLMFAGFGLGGLAGEVWEGGDVGLPTDPVPVSAVQAPAAEEPEVETRTVISLPEGPVEATFVFTHLASDTTFDGTGTLEQTDGRLSLTVTGREEPFEGTIDEDGNFSINSSDGSFDGTIVGDTITADHELQGEEFTVEGNLEKAAVEETVTEEVGGGQSDFVFAGALIAADILAGGDGNGGLIPAMLFGLGLALALVAIFTGKFPMFLAGLAVGLTAFFLGEFTFVGAMVALGLIFVGLLLLLLLPWRSLAEEGGGFNRVVMALGMLIGYGVFWGGPGEVLQ